MKRCMELANLLHMYALKITDEHKRKSYMDYAKRWQSHGVRMNILKDAQVYHPISASEFDAAPYILNCKNGTIHVNDHSCTEHNGSDKLTKISDVIYDPDAHSAHGMNLYQKSCLEIWKKPSFYRKSSAMVLPEILAMSA